jgi:hypothetical protein
MSDIKSQLEMHEQMLNKYKKLLEIPSHTGPQSGTLPKSLNARAFSNDSSVKVNNEVK